MSDQRPSNTTSTSSSFLGLRRTSSSTQQRQGSRSSPTLAPPRRQSTQERIETILENGRERATSMGNATWSSGRSPNFRPLPQSPEADDGPDEQTGMFMKGNPRDYQATQIGSHNAVSHRSAGGRASSDSSRQTPANAAAAANGNGAHRHDESAHASEKQGWGDYFSGLWSIELENKGSVARDHLALERTFLAWLRTSLAFASIGIAVTQLFRLNTSLSNAPDDGSFHTIRQLGKPLGAAFLAISILVLFLGYQRYVQSQQWVMKGKFPASRGTIVIVSLIALALMVVSLIVVVVIQPANAD
ncbi:hypothetical protein PFICI_01827 [Pestalotiopsis fici W106-1]|uniref:DUF202 domain-containing protein n=1 Tax=Pestalotiopsis fici (strain W106-1 / CGMCC3.15140) TaxID=1229662 RepID=W3XPT7_PESFW|nr:uncharacterized protein PFICI_01827 [Pestalotiopsis fici W106-1]ETS87999.1 hypothetical protein PFICI_01827 [Pestalotiopsis fici W106-1]